MCAHQCWVSVVFIFARPVSKKRCLVYVSPISGEVGVFCLLATSGSLQRPGLAGPPDRGWSVAGLPGIPYDAVAGSWN